jgi:hypothetical protein
LRKINLQVFVPPVSFCYSLGYSNNTEGKLSAALQNREACNASSGTPNRDVDWLLTPCFWSTAWRYSVVSAHSDPFPVSMAKTAYGATGALSAGLQSSGSLHWVSVVSFRKFLSLFLQLSGTMPSLFRLSLAKTEACEKGKGREVRNRFHNRWSMTSNLWECQKKEEINLAI